MDWEIETALLLQWAENLSDSDKENVPPSVPLNKSHLMNDVFGLRIKEVLENFAPTVVFQDNALPSLVRVRNMDCFVVTLDPDQFGRSSGNYTIYDNYQHMFSYINVKCLRLDWFSIRLWYAKTLANSVFMPSPLETALEWLKSVVFKHTIVGSPIVKRVTQILNESEPYPGDSEFPYVDDQFEVAQHGNTGEMFSVTDQQWDCVHYLNVHEVENSAFNVKEWYDNCIVDLVVSNYLNNAQVANNTWSWGQNAGWPSEDFQIVLNQAGLRWFGKLSNPLWMSHCQSDVIID
jgi:hypothetical protein